MKKLVKKSSMTNSRMSSFIQIFQSTILANFSNLFKLLIAFDNEIAMSNQLFFYLMPAAITGR